MQEFLDGEPKPQPKQSTDEPNVEGSMAPVQAALELSAAKKDDAPERNNRVWSEIEVEKVKILKNEGKNIAQIATAMSRDGAWNTWINRWTAEEARHGIVIRDYLMATRGVDPNELEDLRMAHMQAGYQTPYENDMLHTVSYVTFQELATRISHRNTGRISNDQTCEGMLARVALDENLHMLFYRNLLGAALDLEPNAAMIAIKDVVTNFQMPGAGMPGWGRKSVQIALAGIYDPKSHIEDVVAPVLRAWNIFNREDFTGEGAQARDELAKYIADTEVDVAKFVEKRDNHFDRLEARGQNPIRLKD